MIQFNLLPDVKIEYIKTRYRKRMAILISAIASAVAVAIFMLLFLFVRVNQTEHLKDLDKDIKDTVSDIQSTQDLDKILTIQNQLNSLPDLHDKKVVSSRLVDYFTRLMPNEATFSNIEVNFETNTMEIKGNADKLQTVNKFADTLKFTTFKVNNKEGKEGKAFKDVVLDSFTVATSDPSAQGSALVYEMKLGFDPLIFAQIKDLNPGASEPVSLIIPNITSTRSATEKPTGLFAPQPKPAVTEGGQ